MVIYRHESIDASNDHALRQYEKGDYSREHRELVAQSFWRIHPPPSLSHGQTHPGPCRIHRNRCSTVLTRCMFPGDVKRDWDVRGLCGVHGKRERNSPGSLATSIGGFVIGFGPELVDAFSLAELRRSSWQRCPISRFMLSAVFSQPDGEQERGERTRTSVGRGAPRRRSYGSGDSTGRHG